MTKFILSGGFANKAKDGGRSFCEAVLSGARREMKILECLFALSDETWDGALEKDKQFFGKAIPEAEIEFIMASADKFLEQLSSADAVYFRGGDTKRLKERLEAIEGWQSKLEDKIVIGSSAGAYILAKHYLDLSSEQPSLGEGFGLLPIKIAAHYESDFFSKPVQKTRSIESGPEVVIEKIDWRNVDKIMAETEPELEYVPLREGEFRIFEK